MQTTQVESNVQNTRNSIKLSANKTSDAAAAGETKSEGRGNVFGSLS